MAPREAINKLVAEVLDDTHLRLQVDSYTLRENLESRDVEIHCEVHHRRTGEKNTIHGHGVGLLDAFFRGMIAQYVEEYPSLETIRFADFTVKARADGRRGGSQTDASAEVNLTIANSKNREFTFTDASPSITRSAIHVVLEGVAFFINCERAFKRVYSALKHARDSGRPDSVERYTQQLVTLVDTTSYTDVIDALENGPAIDP